MCIVQCVVQSIWVQVNLQVQVKCVVYTVQCIGCKLMLTPTEDLKVERGFVKLKIYFIKLLFKSLLPSVFLKRFETIHFRKPKLRNLIKILLIIMKNFKSFSVTPPSGCRRSAKSTFLVIDMKTLYKHIPKVGEENCFYFI